MRAGLQNGAIGAMLAGGAMAQPATMLALPGAMALNRALGSPALAKQLITTKPGSLAFALEQSSPAISRALPAIYAD
jgi:hypothetical protein